MRIFAVFLLFLVPQAVHSEYRVFVLKIGDQFVESTLDPDQYRGYSPVPADQVITYVDTWRCYGRTDGKPHCPNPRAPSSVEGPESAPAAAAPSAP